ncbi:MAG TPA: hypothetical protein VLK37_06925 [Solirubrobacterales bacterium]|nr:hypothetical protein [Solirubrobacterales bacterium]
MSVSPAFIVNEGIAVSLPLVLHPPIAFPQRKAAGSASGPGSLPAVPGLALGPTRVKDGSFEDALGVGR